MQSKRKKKRTEARGPFLYVSTPLVSVKIRGVRIGRAANIVQHFICQEQEYSLRMERSLSTMYR